MHTYFFLKVKVDVLGYMCVVVNIIFSVCVNVVHNVHTEMRLDIYAKQNKNKTS